MAIRQSISDFALEEGDVSFVHHVIRGNALLPLANSFFSRPSAEHHGALDDHAEDHRVSNERPIEEAFCQMAPSVRLSFLAILFAFCLPARAFICLMSAAVQVLRFTVTLG